MTHSKKHFDSLGAHRSHLLLLLLVLVLLNFSSQVLLKMIFTPRNIVISIILRLEAREAQALLHLGQIFGPKLYKPLVSV